jgi:hypothetical protein
MSHGSFLSIDRDFEVVEMVIPPFHDILDGYMKIVERVAFRDLYSSPDGRLGIKKDQFKLIDVLEGPPSRNG